MFIRKKKFEAEIEKARASAYRETELRIHENDDVLRDINRRLLALETATRERTSNEVAVTTDVGYWV